MGSTVYYKGNISNLRQKFRVKVKKSEIFTVPDF